MRIDRLILVLLHLVQVIFCQTHELVIRNIANLGNTELYLISDSHHVDLLRSTLNNLDVPLVFYGVQDLKNEQMIRPTEHCPSFSSTKPNSTTEVNASRPRFSDWSHVKNHPVKLYPRDDPILHLREQILKPQRYHRSFVFWLHSSRFQTIFDILDDSILWCDEKIEVGLYNEQTRFYFIVENRTEVDRVFEHHYLRKHSKVVAMYKVNQDHMAIFNYNFFKRKIETSFIWRPERLIKNIDEIFTSLDDFHGYHFKIGTNPWAHHVIADEIPEEEGGNATSMYQNYRGYEILLLKDISQQLNFNYTLVNPEDGLWGHFHPEDGTWSGMVFEAAAGRVDFIMSDIFIIYPRNMVFEGTITFDMDFQVFAAPMPRPLPQYLSTIYPFTFVVWVCLLLSMFVGPFMFLVVSRMESKIQNHLYTDWNKFQDSFWYAYGTFLGEAITRDTNSSRSYALRWLVGIWILYCFVVSSSYAGSLKAFLTNPAYTSPINTLEDVLDSGLPWEMVLYGEEEEKMMAESNDPVIQTIWRDKIVVDFSPTPQIEGVFRGETIFIDYISGLDVAIYVSYSTPGGDPLIYRSKNPVFMPNYPGWGFHKFNPWETKFNRLIRRNLESGMIAHYKSKTLLGMKEDARAKGQKAAYHKERSERRALTLTDMQGVFSVVVLGFIVSILGFITEVTLICCKSNMRHRQPGEEMSHLGPEFQTAVII